MLKRLVSSLYWLLIIGLFLSGCSHGDLPKDVAVTENTPTFTELVVTRVETEVLTLEPIMPDRSDPGLTGNLMNKCKRIVYSEYKDTNYDLVSVCPDGSGLVILTHDPTDELNPAWSPDGTRIAFAATSSGHFQIYQMSEDGTQVTQLTYDYENQFPVWLPDGRHIAFRTDDGKGLYWWRILNLETSELTTFTQPSFDFFSQTPAWSPDGQKIAYMSLVEQKDRNDGSTQIHVINTDGTNDIALTQDIWANFNPKWSPDGTKIAFLSERGGTYEMFALYVMNADGTDVQQLTETGYPADVVYSWSGDGKQIVIGGNNLFNGINIIDVEAKTLHPLMDWEIPANVNWPAWQP